jgi:hypothetical protein
VPLHDSAVDTRYSELRVRKVLHQVAVVCHKEDAFRIEIEASNGHKPSELTREKIVNGLRVVRIAAGNEISCRLIEH